MAEEFQVEFYGTGNWWNSPRNIFGWSPCSSDVWWTSCNELIIDSKSAAVSTTDGDGGLQKKAIDSGSTTHHQTSTDQWNQKLLNDSRRSQQNHSPILQEINQPLYSTMNGPSNHDQQLLSNSQLESSSSLNFPLDLSSYNCGLLQGLFDDSDSQIQEPVLDDQEMKFYSEINSEDHFFPSMVHKKSKTDNNHLPFWNSESANLGCVSSAQSQFLPLPPTISNIYHDITITNKKLRGDSVLAAKKSNCYQPSLKHPRMETPSPLPTFKLRKEKFGDRITALQQLVSPFGKTDAASVLHEAIDYIKFLHDQVNALTTPYLKNGPHPLQHPQAKDKDGLKQDLRGRGLCLMPISITFPVTAETTSDFWTHTFGGSFRLGRDQL